MYPDRIAVVVLMVLAWGVSAAEPIPVVRDTYVSIDGVGEFHFDIAALTEAGLVVSAGRKSIARGSASRALLFGLEATKSPFHIVAINGDYSGVGEGEMSARDARVRVAGSSGGVVESVGLRVVRESPMSAAFEFSVYGEGRLRLFDLTSATVDFWSDSDTALLDGDVRVSDELAAALGMDEAAGVVIGRLAVSIRLKLIESLVMDTAGAPGAAVGGEVGPDVIVGRLASCQQFGRVGAIGSGVVGLAIGTDSCNKGDVPFNWFALPNGDHPMIPMHLYRLKTVNGSERFEQLGYSWMKHGFTALQRDFCGFGCMSSGTGTLLGVGCSDPYSTGLNASQCLLGPRSVINPYTGAIPVGGSTGPGGGCSSSYPSKDHRGHEHTPISHRIQVLDTDLLPDLNDGARYFGEAQYLNQHEYDVANGNQNNNVSRREFSVTGPDGNGKFTLSNITGSDTVRESPAIDAWVGAEQALIEPEPLVDGRGFLASKVTDLGGNQWHYEYAVYNMNLDRAFGWFQIPVPDDVTVTNIGFHQPRHHAPELNSDNYASDEWSVSRSDGAVTWTTDSFIVDPLANPVRFGTLYNFRFDADAPPRDGEATVGMFKTLDSMEISAPVPLSAAPTIVHGSAIESFSAIGFGGYVDPRGESTDGENFDLGLTEVTFRFSTPVEDENGSGLRTASFVVRETGAGRPPSVVDVFTLDNQTVTVTLSRIITLKEWTTIEARVRSITGGVGITSFGDQGIGMNEPDRIDIAYLPYDIDQNGVVQPFDLLRYRQIMSQVFAHPRGIGEDYIDTDRSGSVAPIDLLRFRQLWSGTGSATRSWAGESLNNDRP